jgi:hypothetical protein
MNEDVLCFEDGTTMVPTDETVIECHHHGVTAKWGNLSAIQRLAVSEGWDTDQQCILVSEKGKQ